MDIIRLFKQNQCKKTIKKKYRLNNIKVNFQTIIMSLNNYFFLLSSAEYAEKAEVNRFDFDKETTEYIENAKMNLMNEKRCYFSIYS